MRYLLPAFALIAVLGGWALAEIPDNARDADGCCWSSAACCASLNVRLMYTGSWANLTLCPGCCVDRGPGTTMSRNSAPSAWPPNT